MPIAGASDPSYTVTAADAGHQLACQVTASNRAGSADAQNSPVTIPTGGTGGGTGGGASGGTRKRDSGLPASTEATISGLRETNRVFAVAGASTPLSGQTAAARHRKGTIFLFGLDQPATIKITIQTGAPGRRAGRACKPPSRKLAHKPRCTRTLTVATLTRRLTPDPTRSASPAASAARRSNPAATTRSSLRSTLLARQ